MKQLASACFLGAISSAGHNAEDTVCGFLSRQDLFVQEHASNCQHEHFIWKILCLKQHMMLKNIMNNINCDRLEFVGNSCLVGILVRGDRCFWLPSASLPPYEF